MRGVARDYSETLRYGSREGNPPYRSAAGAAPLSRKPPMASRKQGSGARILRWGESRFDLRRCNCRESNQRLADCKRLGPSEGGRRARPPNAAACRDISGAVRKGFSSRHRMQYECHGRQTRLWRVGRRVKIAVWRDREARNVAPARRFGRAAECAGARSTALTDGAKRYAHHRLQNKA
jgi:hypothetical protein